MSDYRYRLPHDDDQGSAPGGPDERVVGGSSPDGDRPTVTNSTAELLAAHDRRAR